MCVFENVSINQTNATMTQINRKAHLIQYLEENQNLCFYCKQLILSASSQTKLPLTNLSEPTGTAIFPTWLNRHVFPFRWTLFTALCFHFNEHMIKLFCWVLWSGSLQMCRMRLIWTDKRWEKYASVNHEKLWIFVLRPIFRFSSTVLCLKWCH